MVGDWLQLYYMSEESWQTVAETLADWKVQEIFEALKAKYCTSQKEVGTKENAMSKDQLMSLQEHASEVQRLVEWA